MNQKSSDKKKTSEIFEGVNSTLHQSFVEAVEREKEPKELSACCNAEVATANSGLAGETNYYICTKCHNDCDVIAKPKELDWEKQFDDKYQEVIGDLIDSAIDVGSKTDNNPLVIDLNPIRLLTPEFIEARTKLEQFINQTLTQQRTELLEGINQLVKNLIKGRKMFLEDGSLVPDVGVIPELRQYNQAITDVLSIIRLLNKKDET